MDFEVILDGLPAKPPLEELFPTRAGQRALLGLIVRHGRNVYKLFPEEYHKDLDFWWELMHRSEVV